MSGSFKILLIKKEKEKSKKNKRWFTYCMDTECLGKEIEVHVTNY